jgi:hypothetical protein
MSDDIVPPPSPEPTGTLVPPERQLPPTTPSTDRLATEPGFLRVIRRAVDAALDVADDLADMIAGAIDSVRSAAVGGGGTRGTPGAGTPDTPGAAGTGGAPGTGAAGTTPP